MATMDPAVMTFTSTFHLFSDGIPHSYILFYLVFLTWTFNTLTSK